MNTEEFLRARGARLIESRGEWILEYGIVLGGLAAAGQTLKAKSKEEALSEACEFVRKAKLLPLPSTLL